MRRQKRIAKFLSKNWYSKYQPEEIDQEEQIQLWQNPDLAGYEGLLSYCSLFYNAYKDQDKIKTIPLKKNMPGKLPGIMSYSEYVNLVQEVLQELEPKSVACVLIQGCIANFLYGKEDLDVTALAKYLRLSRTYLYRLRSSIQCRYQK